MHGDDTVCVDLSNCTRLHARKSHVEAARALRADQEADWCRCDHQRATHEAKGMPGCMAYGCSCPSFEYEDGPREPDPCENDCKAAADELARQTQDMNRCRDLKDLIQPEDPFEGEQGNCLHGMGPEAMPAFKPGDRVRGRYTGREMEVIGPAEGYRVRYLDNGQETCAAADLVEPIPPTNPRVDVVAKAIYENQQQRPWEQAPDVTRALWRDHAHAALAALDAWGEKTVTFPKWEGD